MADLDETKASLPIKIIGSDPTGAEQTFVSSDSNGNLKVINPSVSVIGNAIPGDATLIGGKNQSGNLQAIATDYTGRVFVDFFDSSGNSVTLGQKTSANSLPITISSDQSSIPVSQSGIWNINNISGSITLPSGAATSSLQTTGNTTLSTISSQLPTSLGQHTSASSLAVVLPSDQVITISSLPATGSKFSFGQVTTTAVTQVAVQNTTYTEPSANSTMTLVSSNANDTSTGTGARTVIVTYLDQTGAGPFTTTFTLNGTTPVSASVNNMCFIEKMNVATVGSTGSNTGILTLKTGGGATVGTIAATINTTLWAHHYTPLGKTTFISGFSVGNNGTGTGNGATFVLKASTPTIPNTPELQVSDFVVAASATSTNTRIYDSQIQVVGPARIRAYVSPASTGTITQNASFDYIDN